MFTVSGSHEPKSTSLVREFRVLVTGGRDYEDYKAVQEELVELFMQHVVRQPGKRRLMVVIHGGASGADHHAGQWCRGFSVPAADYVADSRDGPVIEQVFPANWTDLTTPPVIIRYRRNGEAYNAAAGGIRNQRMLDEGKPDLVLAFPGGKGTADMVRRARKAGVPVREILLTI